MNNPLTPLTPDQTAVEEAHALREGYLHRVFVAIDQAANVILGGLPDETISSRTARLAHSGSNFNRAFSWLLTKIGFGRNHGALAVAADDARAALVASTEKASGLIVTRIGR